LAAASAVHGLHVDAARGARSHGVPRRGLGARPQHGCGGNRHAADVDNSDDAHCPGHGAACRNGNTVFAGDDRRSNTVDGAARLRAGLAACITNRCRNRDHCGYWERRAARGEARTSIHAATRGATCCPAHAAGIGRGSVAHRDRGAVVRGRSRSPACRSHARTGRHSTFTVRSAGARRSAPAQRRATGRRLGARVRGGCKRYCPIRQPRARSRAREIGVARAGRRHDSGARRRQRLRAADPGGARCRATHRTGGYCGANAVSPGLRSAVGKRCACGSDCGGRKCALEVESNSRKTAGRPEARHRGEPRAASKSLVACIGQSHE